MSLPILSPEDIQQALNSVGTKQWGYIKLLESADGTPVLAPVCVVSGRTRGPLLYLGAGLHGDEYNSMEAVRQTLANLSPEELAGGLIGVVIQNPRSFRSATRLLQGELKNADLNRVFPGSLNGTSAERMAAALFDVVSIASCVLDLHTASTGYSYIPTAYIPYTRDLDSEPLHLAEAFGVDAIVRADVPGSLLAAALDIERAGIIVELGAGGVLEEESVHRGLAGIQNVLSYMGMLEVSKSVPSPRWIGSALHSVQAEQGGFLYHECQPGEVVAKEQTLAHIKRFPDEVEVLRAPCDGIVVRQLRRAYTNPGDSVVLIGPF